MSDVSNLTKDIVKALKDYTNEVNSEILYIQDELAKEGVQLLKSSSPKDKGEYAESWTHKKTKIGRVLYNKKYQITHLLENGHVKRGGGRVAARVHIRPVEEKLIDEFEKRVERAIQS